MSQAHDFFGGTPDLHRCHTSFITTGQYRCLISNGAACMYAQSTCADVICHHPNNFRLQGLAFLDHRLAKYAVGA